MEIQYFNHYSPSLSRDMEMKVWGHAGRPVLFIPCQNGRFYDFENFGMLNIFRPLIESGEVMVFSIDTVDSETWSNSFGDPRWRSYQYEQWIHYIVKEVAPFMQAMAMERNRLEEAPGILVFGCSLGATHAVNLYFRFPDLFDRLLALSGVYTASYGFGDYMDELLYYNSPVTFLPNMPVDHPYLALYNQRKAVVCVGTGAWEKPEYTGQLDRILQEKGIPVWVDYWGADVSHDWYWWFKQADYFLPYLLEDDKKLNENEETSGKDSHK